MKKFFVYKNVKPTKSNVKKSLFSVLSNYIENKICLDLFSGSGSLGIESLLRKANSVFFNDICYKNIFRIKKNVKRLNFKNAFFYNSNAFTFIKKINFSFDLIFIDPPYKLCNGNKFLKFIDNCLLRLKNNGKIYLEFSKSLIPCFKKFNLYKKKIFGNTSYIIINKC